MKIVAKITLIALITIILIFYLPAYSKAFSIENIIDNGNSFLNINKETNYPDAVPSDLDEGKMKNISNMVSGVLLTIALVVTLISAVMMGINFTVQSIEDKAKIKESMIPWVIGIFVSFGAYGIWKITMGVFYNFL